VQLGLASRRRLALVEGAAVAACAVFLFLLGARLAAAPWTPLTVAALATGCVTGYLAADFVSGLVHCSATASSRKTHR
jgi:hypothetical protein